MLYIVTEDAQGVWIKYSDAGVSLAAAWKRAVLLAGWK